VTERPRAKPIQRLFGLEGEVALVTGGAGGIGAAVSRLLIEAGARVAIADCDLAAAQSVAQNLGGEAAQAVEMDVTDPDQVARSVEQVVRRFGSLSILVNNAGVSIRKSAFDLSIAEWGKVLDVNLKGAFLCARAAAEPMLARGAGAVVNVASIMGLSGGTYPNPSYQASKGALVNLTRALAVEWAPTIRVNAVAPTWVRTGFIGPLLNDASAMERVRSITPMQRIAEPEEVAAAVLFLCSPASSMTTGHILAVDGGFLAQ
jgi:NAD(P)-dependent dehydrogenase (short-subunit alcohol dehydrogenase family)